MGIGQVAVYVDRKMLGRLARQWAREQKALGIKITQPNSAYLRWLLEREDRKPKD